MPDLLPGKLLRMQQFYQSGETRTYDFRKTQLQKLKAALLKYEKALYDALYKDLKKSPEESWITETGFVIAEINAAIKALRYWMQPEKAATNLVNFPSTSFIKREPLGVVLITGPWNYPLQLLITPVVGAIAAGNCMVVKPSEVSVHTSSLVAKILRETFNEAYLLCVEGDGRDVIPAMMNHFRFDHVFFTGNAQVGKIIYKMAAEQLTPVTLELGGKSPCIVESDANIKVAARRIVSTKFSNAGQMCVAADYILVHQSRKDALIRALKRAILKFYSRRPAQNYHYGKIINEKQFDRLTGYLDQGTIVHGGEYNKEQLFIAPTILTDVSMDSPLMKEEIFGPLLPVFTFETPEQAKAIIRNNPDPLAFYVYTSDHKKEKMWLDAVAFGGGCVNNSSWHLTNYYLPFGGRGQSGIGQYHGRDSFELFSHRKAIMKSPTWFDPAIKYPPFKGRLKLFRWIVR